MDINWFPGHMAKTRRLISEKIKLVDVVIEIIDARIPVSSRNPLLEELIKNKPVLMLLNKEDMADKMQTEKWLEFFNNQENHKALGFSSLAVNKKNQEMLKAAIMDLSKEKRERWKAKGIKNRAVRCMVIGIPNVGKSTFINSYVGKKAARTGNKPGVTKGQQWIKLSNEIEMLDMPGILWPKFEEQVVGINLALTGAIKEEILNKEELMHRALNFLKEYYPQNIKEKYKLSDEELELSLEDLVEVIAVKRGCLLGGGKIDFLRVSSLVLNELRNGGLGRITFESFEKEILLRENNLNK